MFKNFSLGVGGIYFSDNKDRKRNKYNWYYSWHSRRFSHWHEDSHTGWIINCDCEDLDYLIPLLHLQRLKGPHRKNDITM